VLARRSFSGGGKVRHYAFPPADLKVRLYFAFPPADLKVGLYFLLAIALLGAPASAFAQNSQTPAEPAVVVSGEGIVEAVPDRAWVAIAAESRAANPKDAQRRNVEAMAPVQAKLKAAGIPADAIRTVGYDLQQEFDYVNNKRISRGYVARNSIEVRVDQIDRVGEILEIAVGSGATTVNGIRFDLKERAKLEREALRLAVADAREKAQAAASGAGRTIDRILRIEEQGVSSPPPMPMRMMREVSNQAADATPPISAGQIEIRANVTVVVTIK
jgi:uncharacterized protein YggE